MRSLFKKKINWDVATLIAIWLVLSGTFAVAYSIIAAKREQVEMHCYNRHGILFTDRTGDYICIREKSVIK